ncbi:unnamed protein product [Fusarium equiseti]|uniref:Uncharacterized protein n=1 Tax=Fusarium equiseti TaxID=61235 RepID=A0A8J2NBE5_FUSEQ|nr:unnamed protein product [Fusarium equiseti]
MAKMSDLKREIEALRADNERLASENEALRSVATPTSAMAYIAKKFNLATGDRRPATESWTTTKFKACVQSCPLAKPLRPNHDTMSSQKRRVDEEAAGRTEERATGIYNKEAMDFTWPLLAQLTPEFNFQTQRQPAVDTLVQLVPQIRQLELERLSHIDTLERQIKDLGSKIQRLYSENEKLRVKPAAEDGTSPNTIVGKDDQDYLAEELKFVYKVASKLGLSLEKPTDHRELPILCGVICDEEQLAHLTTFMTNTLSFPFHNECLFCLKQVGLGAMAPMLVFGEDDLRCEAHKDDDAYVWISKHANGWFIGTGRG